jgi:hypothetical protein
MATVINDLTAIEAVGSGFSMGSVSEETIDRIWRFAERIAPSRYLDPKIQHDVATVFHILCTGQELGLAWTTSLRSIFKDGMRGAAILGLLQSHGFKVEFVFSKEPVGCTCTITRPGDQEGRSRTFTLDDARRIKTEWNPNTKEWRTLADNPYYVNYPEDCCQWRSLVRCGRVQAADVIANLYLPEELSEVAEQAGQDASAGAPAAVAAPDAVTQFAVGEKEPEVINCPHGMRDGVGCVTCDTDGAAEAQGFVTPKPAVVEMPKPAAAPVVEYHIRLVTMADGTSINIPEILPQRDKDTAILMARAEAEKKSLTYVVVEMVDGKPREGDGVVAVLSPKPVNNNINRTPAAATNTVTSPETAVADGEAPPPTFDELIDRASLKIGGEAKAAHKVIDRYMGGFLGVKAKPDGKLTLPKDRAKLLPSLQKLVGVIDQRLADLKAEPEKLGEELAARTKSPLELEYDTLGWPVPVREMSDKVMGILGLDEKNYAGWLQMEVVPGIVIASLEPKALEIFFPLFLLARGRSFEPLEYALANQKGLTQTLEDMVTAAGRPVSTWDSPFAVSVLDAIKTVASEPVAAAAPADDWADVGLPFG